MNHSTLHVLRRSTCLISIALAVTASSCLLTEGQTKKEKKPSEMTLGEARARLLGKTVVVGGQTHDYPFKGELTEWELAVRQGARYVTTTRTTYLPDIYQGKEAVVVAVQLNDRAAEA